LGAQANTGAARGASAEPPGLADISGLGAAGDAEHARESVVRQNHAAAEPARASEAPTVSGTRAV